MFKVNIKETRTTNILTLNIFHTCSSVSIVNFERVSGGQEIHIKIFIRFSKWAMAELNPKVQ